MPQYCSHCGGICNEFIDKDIKRHKCSDCGKIQYRNPFPCVSMIITNQSNEILLGLRSNTSIYPNQWCLPCGYIEYDETYFDAAKREAKEETGIDIEPLSIINVVSNELNGDLRSLVIVIYAKAITSKIKAGDDISNAKWFDLASPLPPLAFKADLHIINKYLKYKNSNTEMPKIEFDGYYFNQNSIKKEWECGQSAGAAKNLRSTQTP